ncbi:hypothetical protein VTK56DRAFT_3789 [Thermocarpiscus australiensis]
MGVAARVPLWAGLVTSRASGGLVPSVLGLPRLSLSARVAARHAGLVSQVGPDRAARYAHSAATETGTAPEMQGIDASPKKRNTSRMSHAGCVAWDEELLTITFSSPGPQRSARQQGSPGSRQLKLSPLWLRDACPCAQCVDPDSGQKNFSTTALPDRPEVESAELGADGSLQVVWANDRLSGGGSHTSVFPAADVQSMRSTRWARGEFRVPCSRIPWDRRAYETLLAGGSCRIAYSDWMLNEDAFRAACLDLYKTGLIFVTDVPDGEDQVERIANRIGPLMHTFYGWTWDVKSKPRAENVAYTSQFLGLHQDLMYHEPVPKLQLLHCLANSCEGGESLFSNGVRAAYELMLKQPDLYRTLTMLKTYFHYEKGGHHYFRDHRTIEVDAGSSFPQCTNWSPPFQTTFRKRGGEDTQWTMETWKHAANAFEKIVESPKNMIEVKLKPGECVIFDNRRILHGRRAFSTGEGSRWLKGAYISPTTVQAMETKLWEQMNPDPAQRLALGELQKEEIKWVRASMLDEEAELDELIGSWDER